MLIFYHTTKMPEWVETRIWWTTSWNRYNVSRILERLSARSYLNVCCWISRYSVSMVDHINGLPFILTYKLQHVILNGTYSDWARVISGIPFDHSWSATVSALYNRPSKPCEIIREVVFGRWLQSIFQNSQNYWLRRSTRWSRLPISFVETMVARV